MIAEIDVEGLRDRLGGESAPTVVDVREPGEIEASPFAGALCIPMGEIPSRLDEVPRDVSLVILCHHGMRSARVAAFLADQGFADVSNLRGGIDAWSLRIDPSVPRY